MTSPRKKKFSVTPASRPNSEINVTPLVDVVLVLLIIFMVVTPLLEKDIEVRIPDTEQADLVEEVPKDQLVVALTADGDLMINSETVAAADYVARLERILAARSPADRLVFFMADDRTNYAKLVTALDGARQAGAETLGMMTQNLEQAAAVPDAPNVPGAAALAPPAP
ncbi:MAG: biopolymer transporter ExbD [Myxococcaceae bacterium]